MRTSNTFKGFGAAPVVFENYPSVQPVGLDAGENVRVGHTTHVVDIAGYTADVNSVARFQVPQLRTLLVPLDGSPFAERALPLAAKLARRAGAELRIVHVDSTFGHPYTRNRSGEDIIVCMYCAQLEWDKRAYLEGIAKQLRKEYSVRVSPRLLDHRDVALALRGAVRSDVDLVVMAAHGKGLIRRWATGSTVHELIRGSPVPLLIVGADGSFAAPAPDRVRRILIALDGSPGAEQSIGPAMALGEIADTEYLLLRVVPLSSVYGALSYRSGSGELHDAPKRVVLSAAHRYLRRVASRMEQQSCIVDSRVVLGRKSIARSIAAKAAAYNADLIAIATRKDGEMRWLGSTADRLVQFASVPVLIAAA